MVEVGEEGGGVKESEERAAKDCGFGLMVRVDEEKDGRVGVVGGVDSGVTVDQVNDGVIRRCKKVMGGTKELWTDL